MLISIPYLLIIGAGWGFILLSLAECIGMGFITRAIMRAKNREGGFGWGFFLAGIGIIVCASKRRIEYNPPTKPANNYLNTAPLKKETVPPKKPAGWTCASCGKENEMVSNFCSGCGERRHYKWVCASCGKENAPEVKFCPECGNQLTDEQEQVPAPLSMDEQFLENIKTMSSAAEITEAFKAQYAESGNEDMQRMLKLLEEDCRIERMYGNSPVDATKKLENFYKSGMRFHEVDRSGELLTCPVCGKEQRFNRKTCFVCGAFFRE